MKSLGFLLNVTCKLATRPVPSVPPGRLNQCFRRRLNDSIERLLDEACIANNLSAAADLLALLERWHAPRPARYGGERRISDATLQRMRHKLERLASLRGLPVAGLGANPAGEDGNDDGPAVPISGADFFAGVNTVGSHEARAGYSRQWQDVISRLTAEIESKNGMYQIALDRIGDLEALLRLPAVRKALLKAFHPDTYPDISDSERHDLTAQFQRTLAQLNNLGIR